MAIKRWVECNTSTLKSSILYEIGDVSRLPSVQKFASYCRLVKCKAESAGKLYGTQGNKIGNAHLKLAFSEAAVFYLRGNEKAQRYLRASKQCR